MIDETSRERFIYPYKEHSSYSQPEFRRKYFYEGYWFSFTIRIFGDNTESELCNFDYDYLIDNTGSLIKTYYQCQRIYKEIIKQK